MHGASSFISLLFKTSQAQAQLMDPLLDRHWALKCNRYPDADMRSISDYA